MVTKQMLAKAVAMLKQATLVTDLDMNVVYMNRLALQLFGVSKEDESDLDVALNLTIKSSPSPGIFKGVLELGKGRQLSVNLSILPHAERGNIVGYIFRLVPGHVPFAPAAILN